MRNLISNISRMVINDILRKILYLLLLFQVIFYVGSLFFCLIKGGSLQEALKLILINIKFRYIFLSSLLFLIIIFLFYIFIKIIVKRVFSRDIIPLSSFLDKILSLLSFIFFIQVDFLLMLYIYIRLFAIQNYLDVALSNPEPFFTNLLIIFVPVILLIPMLTWILCIKIARKMPWHNPPCFITKPLILSLISVLLVTVFFLLIIGILFFFLIFESLMPIHRNIFIAAFPLYILLIFSIGWASILHFIRHVPWASTIGLFETKIVKNIFRDTERKMTIIEEIQPYKSVWGIIIPLLTIIISITAVVVSQQYEAARRETEQKIELDRQGQETLNDYYQKIGDLILNKQFSTYESHYDVEKYAQNLTTTAIRSLDSGRRNQLIQFVRDIGYYEILFRNVSLSYTDLSYANLYEINLSDSDLRNTNLSHTNLVNADLSNSDLTGADLSYADLSNSKLTRSRLNGANLMGSNLFLTDFYGCDLENTNFVQAHGNNNNFSYSKIINSNFNHAYLFRSNFSDTYIDNTSFLMANLSDSDFIESDIIASKFIGTYFFDVNFTNANLSQTDLTFAILRSASLISTDLSNAILSNARLSDANLTNANLTKADLSSFDFSKLDQYFPEHRPNFPFGIRLSYLNIPGLESDITIYSNQQLSTLYLQGADLTNADLTNANLQSAIVTREQLAKSKSLKGAIMPDGSYHP